MTQDTRDPWTELEKLAREIDPTLPDDLSGFEVTITMNREFQSVECRRVDGEATMGGKDADT